MQILLVLILVSLSASVKATEIEEYRGYLICDEEQIGFFGCQGASPRGLAHNYEEICATYAKHKVAIREPLYFEVLGREAQQGDYVLGPSKQPADSYLDVTKVLKIERHGSITCGARLPLVEIEVLYDAN